MTELKIPEVILRQRRNKNITQEELAAAIGVSAQAVSNWERGGYPDITLLPKIANYFKITVDELIGNDEAAKEEDYKSLIDRFYKIPTTKSGKLERLKLAKEYYAKYPSNFDIVDLLGNAIVNNMEHIDENRALLGELHEKTMRECTDESYRRNSIHRMCYACADDALEEMIGKSELDWSEAIAIGELREDRYLLNGRYDEYRRQRNSTDLLVFMHYIGRNNMQYYGPENAHVFDEPERTAAWECHKMRLLESFGEEGIVPEAWSGCYAEACLRSASAMIGCGRLDEGFTQLDRAFSLYERWLTIPEGTKMSVGNRAVFGNAAIMKCDKNYNVDIYLENGQKVWCPYLWLFWQLKNDILIGMEQWKWFDGVRGDERYLHAYECAKRLADGNG